MFLFIRKLYSNTHRMSLLIAILVLVFLVLIGQELIFTRTKGTPPFWSISNISPRTELNRSIVSSPSTVQRIDEPLVALSASRSSLPLNQSLETTIQCVGSHYNQSCLFKNLYYVDSTFTILTVKGTELPYASVRVDAFNLWPMTPTKREFNSTTDLERFVRQTIDPVRLPLLTLHFGQPWHDNIGHALFDGLYGAFVALLRFPPRHEHPFRILAGVSDCSDCWSEDVFNRFGGVGIIKQLVLNRMSVGRWFLFDEIIIGSGTFCQRCTQPHLQLPGGVELDASRRFRDRMYQQHGLVLPVRRVKHSAEHRTPSDVLVASVIDNKRFSGNDRREIRAAIEYLNNYTASSLNRTRNESSELPWPLIRVDYIHYHEIKPQNRTRPQINATRADSRSPTYELDENKFIAQLKFLRQMDIHVSGPGTGQMYQTFLSDGSVHVNLGGLRPWGFDNTNRSYASFLEQHMTSGAPYIRGLYYPINDRPRGIKRDPVIQLIRQAAQLILKGFSLPVDPRENLAEDGQLFVEMCQKDPRFCSLVTMRLPQSEFSCLDIWIEDFVHEERQWREGGFVDGGRNITCNFDHALLRQLRDKYKIKHYAS